MMSSERLYSTDSLNQMGGGNKEFVRKMCMIFLDIVPEGMAKIKEAWAVRDIKTVFQYAHKIKSNINHLSVESIKEDLLKVELMARENNVDEKLMEELIVKIELVINKVSKEILEDFGSDIIFPCHMFYFQ